MKIKYIEIEAFRGYIKRTCFDFSESDIVLLYGPNGHGKTSFFDAIEWGLTGFINRFEESSDERKSSRFIGNIFSNNKPEVKLELVDATNDRVITVARSGTVANTQSDYGISELRITIHSGDENIEYEGAVAEAMLPNLLINEEWLHKISFNRTLNLTHILGQNRFQDILKGMKDSERYDSLSQLLGTEHFIRFQEVIKETRKRISDQLALASNKVIDAEKEIDILNGQMSILSEQTRVSEQERQVSLKQAKEYAEKVDVPIDLNMDNPYQLITDSLIAESESTKKRMSDLNADQILLNDLILRIPTGAKAIRDEAFHRTRLDHLQLVKLLYIQFSDIEWLNKEVEDFIEGSIRSEGLKRDAEKLLSDSETYEKDSARIRTFAEDLRKEIHVNIDKKILDSLLKVVVEYQGIELPVRMRADGMIRNMIKVFDKFLQSDQQHQAAVKRTAELEEAVGSLARLEDNLRELLASVIRVATQRPDTKSCPACGTEGITAEHLLHHAETRQELIDPALKALEKDLDGWKRNEEVLSRELKENRAIFNELQGELLEFLTEQEKAAENILKESQTCYMKSLQLKQQYEHIEQMFLRFRSTAEKWGIDPFQNELTTILQNKLDQIIMELADFENKYGDRLKVDADLMLFESETAIQRAQNHFSLLETELHRFDITFVKDAQWLEITCKDELLIVLANKRIEQESLTAKEEEIAAIMKSVENLSRSKQLFELQQTLECAKSLKALAVTEFEEFTHRDMLLHEVYKQVPASIEKLNDKVIHELFGSIQIIFEKLNCHPLYRKLSFEKLHRRRANRLMLAVETTAEDADQTRGNPAFIFSSAQENTIILSFFLAMSQRQQWTPLSFIALDDPLQSMDDLNVLSLIDLVRYLADSSIGLGKQIIISTHDLTFYEIMRKKFRHLNVGIIEFEAYGTSGPVLRQDNDFKTVHLYPREPKMVFHPDFLKQTI